MKMPENGFKLALRAGRPQIGLWMGLAHPYVAELLGLAGFDWLVIDGEHAPNDPRSVLPQLQALAPYPVHAVVRPVQGDVALIKQYLDLGVQTLIVPMVETPEQAARIVAATRYPPAGIRGVGSALARASRWNRVEDYLRHADGEMCVVVQVESVRGLQNLDAIARVDGVDGVFFGPADLSASMGLLGRASDPSVVAAIEAGIATVRGAGKAAGVLSGEPALVDRFLAAGAAFVAVGVDTTLLLQAARALAAKYKGTADESARPGGGY